MESKVPLTTLDLSSTSFINSQFDSSSYFLEHFTKLIISDSKVDQKSFLALLTIIFSRNKGKHFIFEAENLGDIFSKLHFPDSSFPFLVEANFQGNLVFNESLFPFLKKQINLFSLSLSISSYPKFFDDLSNLISSSLISRLSLKGSSGDSDAVLNFLEKISSTNYLQSLTLQNFQFQNRGFLILKNFLEKNFQLVTFSCDCFSSCHESDFRDFYSFVENRKFLSFVQFPTSGLKSSNIPEAKFQYLKDKKAPQSHGDIIASYPLLFPDGIIQNENKHQPCENIDSVVQEIEKFSHHIINS